MPANRAVLSGVAFLAAFTLASCNKSPPGGSEGRKDSGRSVVCLGRISPLNGVVRLAQPASSFPGLSPVAAINVREGELVKKGQVIAVLENRSRLETAWKTAVAQALVAKAQQAKVNAAGSPSEAGQRSEVARLSAEVEAARVNQGRSDSLRNDSAISDVGYQATVLALKTSQTLLEEAQQRLMSIVDVDSADRQLVDAQYEAATAEADHAKAELEQAFIRAPSDGQILRINAHPGETIGPDGVVEIAEVNPLYVIAEVDESDADRVRPGERATVSGAALSETLGGVVEWVGTKVGRNGVVTTDPVVASDSRVVEVRIRLDKSDVAAHFLQARVTVVLQP
jgi:HlyD family secretion protein